MEPEAEERAARRVWERLAADHPELAPAADFQRRAWELLRGAAPIPARPTAAAADVRAGLEAGVPLLAAARPRFDGPPPVELLRGLAAEAGRAFGTPDAAVVERASRRDRDANEAVRAALEAALRRDAPALAASAAELGVQRDPLRTLCELAVSPSLQALAETSRAALATTSWGRGWCPMCGAWPVFGELRDADRGRHLRCALCAADWAFPRLRCPFCNETDHRHLHALHVEGEAEHRRAELCDGCRGYVKSLARLAPTPAALLPVEDLATAYLDLLALEAGYARPAGPPPFGDPARESAA